MSGDDGLREAVAQWLIDHDSSRGTTGSWNAWHEDADAVLALPEIAALRAKADAADRVRAALDEVEDRSTNIRDLDAVDRLVLGSQRAAVHQIRAALDGPPC